MKIDCIYVTMEYICQKKNRKLNYIGGDGKEFKKEILSHLGTVTFKGSEALQHG